MDKTWPCCNLTLRVAYLRSPDGACLRRHSPSKESTLSLPVGPGLVDEESNVGVEDSGDDCR